MTSGRVLAESFEGLVKIVQSAINTVKNDVPAKAIPAVRDHGLPLSAAQKATDKADRGRTVQDPRRLLHRQPHPQVPVQTLHVVRQRSGKQGAPEEAEDEDEGTAEEEEEVEEGEGEGPAGERGGEVEEGHGGADERGVSGRFGLKGEDQPRWCEGSVKSRECELRTEGGGRSRRRGRKVKSTKILP